MNDLITCHRVCNKQGNPYETTHIRLPNQLLAEPDRFQLIGSPILGNPLEFQSESRGITRVFKNRFDLHHVTYR